MPKRIVFRGGMADSSLKRNGWTFDAEGLAALATDNPQAPVVIDHNMDVAAVAGHLTKVTAKRGRSTIQVKARSDSDDKKKRKYETRTIPSVFLSKEGVLTEESPGFGMAWKTLQSYTGAGKIPQTSFSIGIDGIDFDDEREAIALMPPYSLIHDAIVSTGAFGPETGVGIMEMEVIEPDAEASTSPAVQFSEDGDEATVSCSPAGIHIANLSAHIASFSATHGDNPAAMVALRSAFPTLAPKPAQFTIPSNPPGNTGEGSDEDEWSRPTLSDFTDQSWEDLSAGEKNRIARHFAWADGSPPSSFTDGLKLPHHRPGSGAISLRGVRNALARLPQTQGIPDEDRSRIEAHLRAHLPDDDDEMDSSAEANHQPLNTAQNLASTRSHMADSPPDTQDAAPQSNAAGAENDLAAMRAEFATLKAEFAAEKQAKAAAEQKRVESLRATLKEEFDTSDRLLASLTTVDALEAVLEEKRADSRVKDAGGRGSERGAIKADEGKEHDPVIVHERLQSDMEKSAKAFEARLMNNAPLSGELTVDGVA